MQCFVMSKKQPCTPATHKKKHWNELDLFNVTEIKRDKNGGVEIKLCDRQKAMEQMLTYASRTETQSQADALLTALTGGTAHADNV